ncbi:3-phosphoshikimate 1-carboxyvinyltransferase [Ferruginivarius sediminum]|uniref:3-phosphoshikimate 1-carboxyvinyltransferase n=1 Tax=Ferruginivarius sediminum TaxID=2661937 RepID=A0A369T4W2_9PROT|nr:3-phosphoshikimate 1-carboxyvinyltransferase [Ferruginivarius sediminum]RDD60359.1 3-phosphoshikimate 1-carboxyvinyltransferase [Ferruginivarius sediminum]
MPPRPLTAKPSPALAGECRVPGDKSISHRALMLAGLAVGESTIQGMLLGEDVLATASAMEHLGATIERGADAWHVWGRGVGGLREPAEVLDLGNSGTGARLLMGVLAGQPITAFLTGDASLRRRPMNRVVAPLLQMGARVTARSGERLPLAITGTAEPLPIHYELPVASAQVKSAVLLAGLSAPGETQVVEPQDTRDHTELMLRAFGAEIAVERSDTGRLTRLTGQPELTGRRVNVPADPSSAAFPVVAALLIPGSRLRVPAVGMNPHRTGLFTTLREMGADIVFENEREEAGERVADITVSAGRLRGVEIPAARAPSMIDEYPILAMAAACAEGRTVMHGVGELRVKESDRLAAVAEGLAACGVDVETGEDWLAVHGQAGRPRGGATVAAQLDHRIAMSFLVLGLASEKGVTVDDAAPIETSFPGFADTMRAAGADIAEA